MSKTTGTQPTRSGLLILAIVLILLSNLLLAAAIQSIKGSLNPDAPILMIWLIWVSALVSVAGGIGMWFWRKWGLYAYIVATIVIVILTFVVFASAGATTWGMIFGGLLPMLIVLYIVKPHWRYFH